VAFLKGSVPGGGTAAVDGSILLACADAKPKTSIAVSIKIVFFMMPVFVYPKVTKDKPHNILFIY
jgi:hypothetical protein